MATLAKIALGVLGLEKPEPARDAGPAAIELPAPQTTGGLPLMEALARRRSSRAFSEREMPPQILSNLLWAAFGVNRPEGHERTAPTARDDQEIEIYVAMKGGFYRYEAVAHRLVLVAAVDARRVTGFQDFVDAAPLDLVYVASHEPIGPVTEERRMVYSAVAAGAIAQNVYLYCASAGLATVVRGWFSHTAIAEVIGLRQHQHVVVAQTVGFPAGS